MILLIVPELYVSSGVSFSLFTFLCHTVLKCFMNPVVRLLMKERGERLPRTLGACAGRAEGQASVQGA